MIPKIIHYCWFGDKEMPKLAIKCLKSWKKYCPDYEIMCWSEKNFDVNCNKYVKEAYENKKFAFVTDYVRLFALYNYGGIYMDTDLQILKSLDEFLNCKMFLGFESTNWVQTALIGAEKNNEILKIFLKSYDERKFVMEDGNFDLTPNVRGLTNILLQKGFELNNTYQNIEGVAVYPTEYFCPINFETKEKNITKNTYTIHWFSGSWVPKVRMMKRIRNKIIYCMKGIFGESKFEKLVSLIKRKKVDKRKE